MSQEKNVDIVIPVYNAYEFTKKCIETVIENTDLRKNTLVVINDKSPDEKIFPMLKEFEQNYAELNIVVLENEINSGFVKTVNKGMKYSDNDVILLNSDTEVTKNWVEKMKETAYIKENIGTVTPLSNNATLASVPNFLEENNLPKDITLEEYAKIVEDCSFNAHPELSTAHGFCMYIKREAIDKVGIFDDVAFEKGYGEENDFSFRCLRNGFINVLCDNTYIYHKGEQSFSGAKAELSIAHTKILEEKYPENCKMNTDLCLNNPYSYIQENVKYSVGNKTRKNVLIVAHEFFKKEKKLVGGTVLHIYDLIENLRSEMNFHVLFAENGKYRVRSFFENSTSEVILGEVVSYENHNLYNMEYRKIVQKVFDFIKVDLVHIHHMMYHYFDIVDLAKEKNIPYIISLHDYYFVCPTFSLLENNEKYCVDMENPDCDNCLKNIKNIDQKNFINVWRENSYSILKNAKLIIAPSESTKNIVNKYFKNLNIQVIEHGMDALKYDLPLENKEQNEKKKIAFLGGINKIKGFDYLKKFVNEVNKEDSKYELHLFGYTSEEEYNKSNGNYIFHGMYKRENIKQLLIDNNIDVILSLSICPETYSYTLTETVMSNIPSIVLDYGALADRVKQNDCGWVMSKDSTYEDILNKLNDIFTNIDEFNKKVENTKLYAEKIYNSKAMAEKYKKVYDEYLVENKEFKFNMTKKEFENLLISTKEICMDEEEIDRCHESLTEYHNTVMLDRAEMDRLNSVINTLNARIEEYKIIEKEYNHLISSRKLNMLKKIGFIEF